MSSTNGNGKSSLTRLGVFDSGLGGLTVLQRLLEVHPERDYIYFGDTAHVPYGSRSADDVVSLVTGIARFLIDEGCEGLILACNTSSALALSALRATFSVPMIGVIGTAAREAARATDGKVVVLANALTAASGVYRGQILNEARLQGRTVQPEIVEIGCPELVPIVENERLYTAEAAEVLSSYAKRIEEAGADTLVLGCTHYPLLLPVLRPLLSERIKIVNPADLIPDYFSPLAKKQGTVEYKVSGSTKPFDVAASKILGCQVRSEQVTLSKAFQTN